MNRKLLFATIISLVIFCFFQVSFSNNFHSSKKNEAEHKSQQLISDSITFKTFKTDVGWGYDIYLNGKLYVHQPNIPAVSGNNGFISEEFAERTAEFVIGKIRKHIMPPTVSVNELDSLKVLN